MKTTEKQTLVLTTEETRTETAVDSFCIKQELRAIPDSTYDRYYRLLEAANIDSDQPVPLYRFVNWQLLYPPRHPKALVYLLALAQRLQASIQAEGYERLVCRSVAEQYQPVVEDVAAATGATVEYRTESGEAADSQTGGGRSRWSLLFTLLGASVLFADELFAWLYSQFASLLTCETMVVPAIDRFESTERVIAKLTDAHVVLPAATTSWLRSRDRYPDVDTYAPTTVGRYVTLGTLGTQVRTYFGLAREILVGRSLDAAIETAVTDAVGFACPNTVRHALDSVYKTPLCINILQSYAFESAIRRTGCERVVTSVGSGSTSQGIWLAAQRCGVDTYYLPHSISLSYTKRNAPGVEKFVPGRLGVRVHDERLQRGSTEEFVPLGRPYLTELYADRQQYETPVTEDGPVRIVVGTEPLDDDVRTAFVESVLDGIERMALDAEITIKIHPDEELAFYERLREERGDDFEILDDQLYDCLGGADLVVTMASNIGLEAIVLGTPNACVTFDRPFVRALPYAAEGPVPTFEAEDEVLDFFETLSREKLQSMRDEQRAFLRKNYVLDADAAEDIARYIESSAD